MEQRQSALEGQVTTANMAKARGMMDRKGNGREYRFGQV